VSFVNMPAFFCIGLLAVKAEMQSVLFLIV
jgi:hypothetical protein